MSDKQILENNLVSVKVIKGAALVVRAINHPLRQQIVQLLHQNGPLNVTQIHKRLSLGQSDASQHLAILRKGRFVLTLRSGRNIYYTANRDRLAEVSALAQQCLHIF